MTVKTNVGHKFLKLLDKHFPKGSPLYPIFNRKKVKLGYRCLPNMGAKIDKHNSKILGQDSEPARCNCTEPADCPLPGKCQTDKAIYRATVTTGSGEETYVGLTAGTFKKRWEKHQTDFRHERYRGSTTLSAHIWKLKDENTAYDVKWKVIGRAAPFSPVSGRCNLCIAEKFEILFHPEKASLNSRNELFSSCRHKKTALLVPYQRKKRDRGR